MNNTATPAQLDAGQLDAQQLDAPRSSMPVAPGTDLLTVTEAAVYLNTAERFARRLVAERRVQTVKLGKHVRIPRAALDEFIAANTRAARARRA